MKKIILLLSLSILLFAACGKDEKTEEPNDNNTGITIQTEDEENKNEATENVAENTKYYTQIEEYLDKETENTFSKYYEILDTEIISYQEDNNEAIFGYRITHKNFDKDPDTVPYIKEAKESNSPNYQTMYDEYLQPKEMNMYFKAVVSEDGTITLYTDVDPTTETEWVETKMDDFILSNDEEE